MSRSSEAGNSVVMGVVSYLAIRGVPVLRMQSRVATVIGTGGKERPMFIGQWTDLNGEVHYGGMADLLAQPRIRMRSVENPKDIFEITVPLWIECKAGTSELTKDQRAFRDYVEAIGAYYVLAKDDHSEVEAWCKKFGVQGVR